MTLSQRLNTDCKETKLNIAISICNYIAERQTQSLYAELVSKSDGCNSHPGEMASLITKLGSLCDT